MEEEEEEEDEEDGGGGGGREEGWGIIGERGKKWRRGMNSIEALRNIIELVRNGKWNASICNHSPLTRKLAVQMVCPLYSGWFSMGFLDFRMKTSSKAMSVCLHLRQISRVDKNMNTLNVRKSLSGTLRYQLFKIKLWCRLIIVWMYFTTCIKYTGWELRMVRVTYDQN